MKSKTKTKKSKAAQKTKASSSKKKTVSVKKKAAKLESSKVKKTSAEPKAKKLPVKASPLAPPAPQELKTHKQVPRKEVPSPDVETVQPKPVERPSVLETKPSAPKPPAPAGPSKPSPIKIEMPITVGNLARKLRVTVSVLIKTLMSLGIFANVNQLLNEEIIWKCAKALNVEIEKEEDEISSSVLEFAQDQSKDLILRPPVVTLMGHVDHGKTSLLDAIRKSDVASKEAGHITQHVGAYNVHIEGKGLVTFLDTPGHEAFTAMRARGANVTDVVVLVVAADDGVMPQTIEAIDHARAAEVPIVVAINKSDLPTADPNRVMKGLQKYGLVPEEWSGKTICVKVSAKTGMGIDTLLEMLLLEAELLELKANPNRSAHGVVLESKLTKHQGAVSMMLVQNGTLKIGDLVVAGPFFGNVRALKNDRGKSVKEAGPSYAVEVLGLGGTPEAGEMFAVVQDEQLAKRIAEKKSLALRERALKGLHSKHMSLEDLYGHMKEGRIKELKLVIKVDVQGSLEALEQSLEQIGSEKIKLRVIHGGVGSISESDMMLAVASDAIVIGFHVKPDDRANALAEKEGVDVRFYNIIYEAVSDIQKAMEGLLEPTMKEVFMGRTEIRQIFQSSKVGSIGGGVVKKGKLVSNYPIRVLRNNIVVHQGRLASLKRFKEDVREVQEGYDCGVVVEGFKDLKEADVIESYRIDKVAAKFV